MSVGRRRGHLVRTLVLSTADWDRPLWTNKQYVARELAAIGPVTYMNSLGLRRPELSVDDLRRILRRFARPGHASGMEERSVAGVNVISPWIVPWHRHPSAVWALNRRSLHGATREWCRSSDAPRVLWTFSPVTYELEEAADLVVYHCVDLLEHMHRVDSVSLRSGEARLAQLPGAVAIASSHKIRDHLLGQDFKDVLLWENVADTENIQATASAVRRRPGHAVFAGNLTLQKVNFDLLRWLLGCDATLHLHLAGPLAEGGGARPDLTWFEQHPRVVCHGILGPSRLAELLGSCSIGLIPYKRSPYTDGVFPMKVYEYLAAGLAVVSTDLPALADTDGVDSCVDANTFVRSVQQRAPAPTGAEVEARQAIAERHSWSKRGRQIRDLVLGRLELTD